MVYSYPYIDPERFRYRNKKNISFGCSNYVEQLSFSQYGDASILQFLLYPSREYSDCYSYNIKYFLGYSLLPSWFVLFQ